MTAGFLFPYRRVELRPYASEKRFDPPSTLENNSTTGPASYDPSSHEVDCILTTGARLRRYESGTLTELSITKDSVDLSRLRRGGIPLLDNHSTTSVFNTIGRLAAAWIEDGKLFGTLRFARTHIGRKAEGMVARAELPSVSMEFTVSEWRAEDEDGDEIEIVNPDWDLWGAGDTIFVAQRWQLTAVSLTTIPRDSGALIL
jgi:hypothetical protein